MDTRRLASGAFSLWLMVGAMIGPVMAGEPTADLAQAVQLFDEGNYVEAQQVLTGIDRSKLNSSQQAKRDDYLSRVQVAITMQEKAIRDLEDAEVALKEGEKSRANQLLESVIANEYAGEALRRSAKAKLREVAGGAPAAAPQAAKAAPVQSGEHVKETVKTSESVEIISPMAATPAQPAKSPQDVELANKLVKQGYEKIQASLFDDAAKLFEEALKLVPGHPEALAGLAQIEEFSRTAAVGTSELLLRMKKENRISWQRAEAEYRAAEQEIRNLVDASKYEEANQLMVRARQVVESAKQFAEPVSDYEVLRAEVDELARFLADSERTYNEEQVNETRQNIETQRSQKLRKVEEERQRQIDALMEQAYLQRKDGDLEGAINTVKQITVIAPKYRPARYMLEDLESERLYRKERDVRSSIYKGQREALIDVEVSKIPWHEEVNYPTDWPELVARRSGGKGANRRDQMLVTSMDKPIRVDFKGEPFDSVVERLASANSVNVLVNWSDLERAGVRRKAPIELNLPGEITLKKALTSAIEQAGEGLIQVGYDIGDGVITVATQATLDKHSFPAVYDITDLLMEIPNFDDAPISDLRGADVLRPRSKAAKGAQLSEQPWRVADDDDDEAESESPEYTGRLGVLIDMIQQTVSPHTWTERGGTIGSIREFNGQLVVTQNSSSQRQIGDLLGKLREQRAVQVAVEARFLTVSSHYLEELGVDLDVVLNAGNAGYDYVPTGSGPLTDPVTGAPLLTPRTFSRNGFSPATPALGNALTPDQNATNQPFSQPWLVPQRGGGSGQQLTPIPVSNSIVNITNPASLGSDIPGSFAGQNIAPAMNIFGSFLDNIQVDFLIRATQADSRTTVLTAPRLVLFNGQRSWVAVTIQQNFVRTLTPALATGAVAQQPDIGTIDAGAVLDVSAHVSSDKRYVCMTLRPGVTRLLDLQTIPFSGGAGGGGFGGGAANQAFIQIPTLSSQRLQTTVCVPDGGTLLIGGQKLASETEVEAGVPGLSKIPILKRLYNSRTQVKDEQTLLILVKPKVLIQAEQEEKAFPGFASGS